MTKNVCVLIYKGCHNIKRYTGNINLEKKYFVGKILRFNDMANIMNRVNESYYFVGTYCNYSAYSIMYSILLTSILRERKTIFVLTGQFLGEV